MTALTHRLASEADIPAIRTLMDRAMTALLPAFLDPAQATASRAIMGLDTQLIADRTYFVVERDGALAGCGGWSRRATLYGGDHSTALRDDALLVPGRDAARVRAMFTDPDYVRQGVGRVILELCESAAREAGFDRAELMATLPGEPLYRACGYCEIERVVNDVAGPSVPLIRMGKPL
jgi:N-acetylglutamate synthase-like GNAT family acetyltransferase